MGVVVNLIEEIRLRLYTAMQSGVLTEIKSVTVGSILEAMKDNDLPVISLNVLSGEEVPYYENKGSVINCRIRVTLIMTKLSQSPKNTLYKTSNSTGGLYILEKIMNVIDKNTSGSVDLQMASKANDLRGYSWVMTEDQGVLYFSIDCDAQTAQFTYGSR